jgi:hypothetical protein
MVEDKCNEVVWISGGIAPYLDTRSKCVVTFTPWLT